VYELLLAGVMFKCSDTVVHWRSYDSFWNFQKRKSKNR